MKFVKELGFHYVKSEINRLTIAFCSTDAILYPRAREKTFDKSPPETILVKKLLANYLQRCFERKNFRRFHKNDVFLEKMFGKWVRRDILGE